MKSVQHSEPGPAQSVQWTNVQWSRSLQDKMSARLIGANRGWPNKRQRLSLMDAVDAVDAVGNAIFTFQKKKVNFSF